jgi:hypothetical protein
MNIWAATTRSGWPADIGADVTKVIRLKPKFIWSFNEEL